MRTPGWLAFILLTLAAFRVYRLIGKDTILDGPRSWLVGLARDWKAGDRVPDSYRPKIVAFITCPWCAGFWVCGVALAAWCAVEQWIGFFGFLVTWFAMSALVALCEKNLDEDE
jgi:hypothetical protein